MKKKQQEEGRWWGGLKGKKQPPMEHEGGEVGRVEGQRKRGMWRYHGEKVIIRDENTKLKDS